MVGEPSLQICGSGGLGVFVCVNAWSFEVHPEEVLCVLDDFHHSV